MKKLCILLGILLAVMLVTPVTAAPELSVLCRVDVGDETSESGHALDGWGPVEPATHGGNWGGIDSGNCRVIWDSSDNDPSAFITLDRNVSDGSAKAIRFVHLDGIANDSFTVEVLDNHGEWFVLGSYTDDSSTEIWVTTEFTFPNGNDLQINRGGPIQVKVTATGEKWGSFDTYGQVAFDVIELLGY